MEQTRAKQEKSGNTRLAKWDNLKGLLIFLVVTGHVFEHYNTGHGNGAKVIYMYIYSFHMPLFLFISGIFSRRNIRQRRWDRIFSMLALYILITLMLGLARVILFGATSVSFFAYAGVSWYAFLLFVYQMIMVFLDRFPQRWVMAGALFVGCMAGYETSLGDLLVLMRGMLFFPFFFAGYCVNEEKLLAFARRRGVRIASVVILAAAALVCMRWPVRLFAYCGLFTGRHAFETILKEKAVYGFLLRIAAYIVSFVMGFCVLSVTPEKPVPVLTRQLGEHSLQIYALHYLPIYVLIRKLDIARFLKPLWPAHYLYLFFPVCVAITLLCSFEVLGKGLDMLINPLRYPAVWGKAKKE